MIRGGPGSNSVGKSPEAPWERRGAQGVRGAEGRRLTFGESGGGHGETPHISSAGLVYIQRTMSAPQQALVAANMADLEMI